MDYDDICIDKVLIAEVRTISMNILQPERNRCRVPPICFFLTNLAYRLDLKDFGYEIV